jgi:hypothetical protein
MEAFKATAAEQTEAVRRLDNGTSQVTPDPICITNEGAM